MWEDEGQEGSIIPCSSGSFFAVECSKLRIYIVHDKATAFLCQIHYIVKYHIMVSCKVFAFVSGSKNTLVWCVRNLVLWMVHPYLNKENKELAFVFYPSWPGGGQICPPRVFPP